MREERRPRLIFLHFSRASAPLLIACAATVAIRSVALVSLASQVVALRGMSSKLRDYCAKWPCERAHKHTGEPSGYLYQQGG